MGLLQANSEPGILLGEFHGPLLVSKPGIFWEFYINGPDAEVIPRRQPGSHAASARWGHVAMGLLEVAAPGHKRAVKGGCSPAHE